MLTHTVSGPVMPVRVVVLGATGVIGKALTRLLLDANVSVLSISSSNINLLDLTAPQETCTHA